MAAGKAGKAITIFMRDIVGIPPLVARLAGMFVAIQPRWRKFVPRQPASPRRGCPHHRNPRRQGAALTHAAVRGLTGGAPLFVVARGRLQAAEAAPWQSYGLTRLMRVAQLASDVRVLLQAPIGAVSHWLSVQVWAMYSEAIQMLLPSTAVAP
jgi:hypothetical protein